MEETFEEKCDYDVDSMTKMLNEISIRPESRHSSSIIPYDHTKYEVLQSRRADFLVNEMMSATSIDEAKCRAIRVLESERAEATRDLEKENATLKQQMELVLQQNLNLKREFANYIERVEQLRAVWAQYEQYQYQDQVTCSLEVFR